MKNIKDIITNTGDKMRQSNTCVIRVLEGEAREDETEAIFER